MRKRVVWFLAVALMFVLANSVFAADAVRIGHTVSMTGGASMWGQSEANAVDMLVKKLNAHLHK